MTLETLSAMCPEPFNSGPNFWAQAQARPCPILVAFGLLLIVAAVAAAFVQQEMELFGGFVISKEKKMSLIVQKIASDPNYQIYFVSLKLPL